VPLISGMTDSLEPLPFDDLPVTPVTTWRVVLIASFVALVIGCVPALATALVVNSNLKDGQDAIVAGRVEQTLRSCQRQNRVIRATNAQADYLAGLILNGTKQSRAFENVYRKLGLPPYDKRLAQAKKQAKGIQDRKLPESDCAALAAQVARQK
jgi:hypothetical protein